MAEEMELESSIKCVKKRSRNPAEWKREKRKRLRIAGKEYINTRGELIGGRKIGEDCRCRRKCYVNVTEEVRKKLFEGYYSLNSHDEQNAYLFGLIRKKDIARKRSKDSVRRTCTYTYYVRNRGKEIQVCRLAFAHIHGISSPKIRNLCLKLDMNVMFPRDGRGKHDHRPKKITNETIDQIRQHIYSIIKTDRVKDFVKEEKNNGPDVNITKMWKDYLCKFEPTIDIDIVSAKSSKGQRKAETVGHTSVESQSRLHQSSFHPSQLSLINTSSQMVNQYEICDSSNHCIKHDPIGGCCSSQISSSQEDSCQEKSETDNHTDDDSGEDEQSRQKCKPAVKHWLYSKVFHEELKFHDFLSLRKRLWDLKGCNVGKSSDHIGNKSAASNLNKNCGGKSERKQKMPKKIMRSKEDSDELKTVRLSTREISNQGAPPANDHRGLHSSEMYILPLEAQNTPQFQPQHAAFTAMNVQPQFTHHSHHPQHTSMQLNLHSFPSAVTVPHPNSNGLQLNAVEHQHTSGPLQCLTSSTTQPLSIAPNPCNYMNMNTTFYSG